MNVDYFDEVCIREKPFDATATEELVRRCAEAGVNTIFWRATGLGVSGYPSRLLQDPATLHDADMSSFLARIGGEDQQNSDTKNEESFALETKKRSSLIAWGERIAASLKLFDPIATARDACRRHGLQFFIWHDPFDEQLNRQIATYPKWRVLGRDGTTTFPGLRSYAIEAAVQDQLAVVDELLAYQPDGLYFSTSCHNRHLHFPEPDDFFGFEEPVVTACRQEMGVDIRTEPFDEQTWHEVKGSFITDFFRRVKKLAAPHGVQLALGTQLGSHTIWTAPVFSTHVPYRFATQWKTWIDEGLADILVLGDYEWPWDNVPIWEAKKMSWPAGVYAADVEWRPYAEYSAGRTQLLWFSSWLSAYAAKHQGASTDSLAGAMEMRASTLRATGADGICLHEAMTFELEADGFATIGAMRETMDKDL
jgi:hypothetical protein